MQNAKDTFYQQLRQRLTAINPARTLVLRGATRPAILVEENELPTTTPPLDCFRLRWTDTTVDAATPQPVLTQRCLITYTTAGTALNAHMDRGRTLAAMDEELGSMINVGPQRASKQSFTNTTAPTHTCIWWSDASFGGVITEDDRLTRTVTVDVMSLQEAGEP